MTDHPHSSNQSRRPSSGDAHSASDSRLVEAHSHLARDKEEPREGFSLLPIIVVFVFCGFGFWAGLYLTRNAAGFSSSAFDLNAPREVANEGPKAFEPDLAKGEKLFLQQCASCHQANGLGVPGAFPPLAGSAWVQGNEERIIKIALAGIAGEIEVKGNKYNGNMPNIGAGLKDAQLANIISYVRSAWGNHSDPVMDTKVAEVRKAIGSRGQYSPKEILEQHPLETK
jgi:mono/diheme cytochrome c family protein